MIHLAPPLHMEMRIPSRSLQGLTFGNRRIVAPRKAHVSEGRGYESTIHTHTFSTGVNSHASRPPKVTVRSCLVLVFHRVRTSSPV